MADGFLFNMIEKLVGKLGSMAVEAWNVRDDVEKLVENMCEIKAVILDAEEQQQDTNNHQIQLWLEKLKDTLYDAEDLLDDFSTEHLRRQVMTTDKKAKKVRIFFSSSNQLVFSFKMASKIKELRKSIEGLNIDGKSFNFTSRVPSEPRLRKERQTHSFIREEQVMGREKEKKELIELLLDTSINAKENVSVISIVGIGGLGKTTLAQLVYNDKVIQQHFKELKMWVCVADDSDVRGFDLKSIAEKILESKIYGEMDQVQRELREKVEGKKYLLVLDDTWNEEREDWLKLMTLLADGAKGSKIIVTTRSQKVAKIVGPSSSLLLNGLDENQSWRLFTQFAFENGQEPENQNLVSIGQEIVKKCAGVPLAIRSIGSLMYSMESEKDWSNFKEKDLVKIDEQGGNKIFQLIKLSYDHLPSHLKKCFALCSLFPKDTEFRKRELILIWIAEGFVESSDESTSIEDTADNYLMTLVDGSFFQDIQIDDFGDISEFKMHDIVHDLACFIANNDYVMVNKKRKRINKQTRHVSFDFCLDSSEQVPSFLLQDNKLRTCLLDVSMEESECNMMISSSKKIRVLGLNNLASTTIPSCIGMLKHLRYLNLSHNSQIEVLPSSITKLINLETLLLNFCIKLRELPKDLWKLTSLRHLELEDCNEITCMPCGIERLANLQTLSQFVLSPTSKHNAGASGLRELNNLRGELKIKGLEYLRLRPTEAKEMNLMGKSHLQSLKLSWGSAIDGDANEMEKDDIILQHLLMPPNIKALVIDGFEGVGVAFSRSDNTFKNLKSFKLFKCIRLQYLPQLEVKALFLKDLPCLEWIVNDNSNGNSSTLSPLSINLNNLQNLKGWCRCSEEEMQMGCCHHQFKRVVYIVIYDCPNMISIPQCTMSIGILELDNVREKLFQQAVIHCKVQLLNIRRIDGLKNLSRVIQHLTAVVSLNIEDCKELDLCNDEDGCYNMQWKELKNLRSLKFIAIPKMEYLPEGLQHVTTLETLKISNCTNLTFLPEWVKSVPNLKIEGCPKLVSLPNMAGNL